METLLTQPPAQSVVKSSDKLASESSNTLDQQLDAAQLMWADWWENRVYQHKREQEPKRLFIGSGEDVCLNML